MNVSRVQAVVMTALPRLATCADAAEWEAAYQQVLRGAAQGNPPNGNRRRSYLRAVWGRGAAFPRHQRTGGGCAPEAEFKRCGTANLFLKVG